MQAEAILKGVAPDRWLIDQVVLNTTRCLEDLSPEPIKTREFSGEEVLDALYPGNPSITVGPSPACYWLVTREELRGRESEQWCQFILPQAFAEQLKYIVLKFDLRKMGPWKDGKDEFSLFDVHSSLVIQLATGGGRNNPTLLSPISAMESGLPLVLVVNDGQDRFEAWFNYQGSSDEERAGFLVRSAKLGGILAGINEPVHMPGGKNIEYFDRGAPRRLMVRSSQGSLAAI